MKKSIEKGLAKARIHSAKKHLFVCLGPDCWDQTSQGEPLWKQIKEKLREAEIMRTKAACFRICAGGPWIVVYPEGTWYGNVTEERFDRILSQHLIGGHPVKEWVVAENSLACPGQWQTKD